MGVNLDFRKYMNIFIVNEAMENWSKYELFKYSFIETGMLYKLKLTVQKLPNLARPFL